jgi:hypothetical protein
MNNNSSSNYRKRSRSGSVGITRKMARKNNHNTQESVEQLLLDLDFEKDIAKSYAMEIVAKSYANEIISKFRTLQDVRSIIEEGLHGNIESDIDFIHGNDGSNYDSINSKKSNNSSKSNKSNKSLKSNKSTKSNKLTKSNKSNKSIKSSKSTKSNKSIIKPILNGPTSNKSINSKNSNNAAISNLKGSNESNNAAISNLKGSNESNNAAISNLPGSKNSEEYDSDTEETELDLYVADTQEPFIGKSILSQSTSPTSLATSGSSTQTH